MANEVNYSSRGSYGLKKWYDSGDSAVVDIVFVHGLTGSRESTWTDKSTGIVWPEVLLKNDLPQSRVVTFGYDADIVHFWSMASQNRIGHHAQTLINVLAQTRERTETEERPIIFVAHSLGGLVVEDALLASKNSAEPHIRQVLECTWGIVFMGTPHCGSDLASWVKVFGSLTDMFKKTNTELLKTLQPDSEVLARIQTEFHTMIRARADDGKRAIKISCFFEELPVRGAGLIVPMHSAILPSYTQIGIHSNHMDMTKFSSSDDPGYMSVSNELWRWTKECRKNMQSQTAVIPQAPGYYHNEVVGQQAYDARFSSQWYRPHLLTDASRRPAEFDDQGVWNGMYHNSMGRGGVSQGGNYISGQRSSGNGKTVAGNNMNSSQDIVFNM